MPDKIAKLRRALERKPTATRVDLDRTTVEALLRALEDARKGTE